MSYWERSSKPVGNLDAELLQTSVDGAAFCFSGRSEKLLTNRGKRSERTAATGYLDTSYLIALASHLACACLLLLLPASDLE